MPTHWVHSGMQACQRLFANTVLACKGSAHAVFWQPLQPLHAVLVGQLTSLSVGLLSPSRVYDSLKSVAPFVVVVGMILQARRFLCSLQQQLICQSLFLSQHI